MASSSLLPSDPSPPGGDSGDDTDTIKDIFETFVRESRNKE